MDDDFDLNSGFDVDVFASDIGVDFEDDALTLPDDDMFDTAY